MSNYLNFRNIIAVLLLVSAAQLSSAAGQTVRSRTSRPKFQTARVTVNENGFQPVGLRLKRGIAARITFLRSTDATCAKDIVVPAYGINRGLPLNQAVTIGFTTRKSGEIEFTCGMNMMRGKLVVR